MSLRRIWDRGATHSRPGDLSVELARAIDWVAGRLRAAKDFTRVASSNLQNRRCVVIYALEEKRIRRTDAESGASTTLVYVRMLKEVLIEMHVLVLTSVELDVTDSS